MADRTERLKTPWGGDLPELCKDTARTTESDLKRISDIIQTARGIWFALLGVLVYAAVTLAGTKDVAFFVEKIETQLPLANISVPTVTFFAAGGLLVAALYIYFHLYLELLWQELGRADATVEGKPLADNISPWPVSDTALRLRDWLAAKRYADQKKREPPEEYFITKTVGWVLREYEKPRGLIDRLVVRMIRSHHASFRAIDLPAAMQRASRRRALGWISNIVSVALVWFFGLAVIVQFWWQSMPDHDPVLTGWLAFVLAATLWVFFKSSYGAIDYLWGGGMVDGWTWTVVFTSPAIALGFSVLWDFLDAWSTIDRYSSSTQFVAVFF